MEVTLLLPQELSKQFSLYQARGSATSTSTVTHQPHLSSWTENISSSFLHPERSCFSVLLRTRECKHSSLFWRLVSRLFPFADLPLPTKLLPFFPSSTRLCGSESPTHGQVWKPCRWVLFPISSLTLEEGFSNYHPDW
jgi:hypothetical protein